MKHTEIYTAFAVGADITFIMEDTYEGQELKKTAVVGWYYGAPDAENTKFFCGDLEANFD